MKSQITKLLLLPMVASIGLFSVACSNAPSNPNANAGNTAANNGNVAVAAPANGAPVAQAPAQAQPVAQAPAQAQPVAQAPVQAQPVRQAPVVRPESSVRPVSPDQGGTNGSRYYVQTEQGDPLNLRASNSTNSAVIGSLPYGTEVIVHLSDRSGEWAEVSAPGNKRGWVAMRFLSQDMAPAPAPAARAQSANPVGSSAMWVKTLDGDSVNIRSGPSLNDSVIGSLSDGSKVFPTGNVVGQWTEVGTGNGGVGYVASEYLVQ